MWEQTRPSNGALRAGLGRRCARLLAAALLVGGCAGNGSGDGAAARDAGIRDSIEEGLRRDSLVERLEVTVRVDDGRAVLQGDVGSEEERERAEEIARSTAGVRSVENLLRVTGVGQREIPAEILQRPGGALGGP
jgi:diphthamide synthase (EF-2-diphthine--ammonia ligase)